jgi:hypothetical protein
MSNLYDVNALIAKYGIDKPPQDPQFNETVHAILKGERNSPDNWLLLDPVHSSELYKRITEAYHNLRRVKPERARELGEPEPFELKTREWEWNDGTGRCCINIADHCDGLVTDLPITFGGLTMIFKICEACRAKAAEDAQYGLMLSSIAAHLAVERPPEPSP